MGLIRQQRGLLSINISGLSGVRAFLITTIIASLVLAVSDVGCSKTAFKDLQSLETGANNSTLENPSDPSKTLPDQELLQADTPSIDSGLVDKSQTSYDPCLPGLYRDWLEFGLDQDKFRNAYGIIGAKITIDRTRFQIRIDALLKDGSTQESYRGAVALGAFKSPTPRGAFIINHIYCYPDVIFFASESQPTPHLYSGFFSPLLICDDYGHCERYHDLGIHGFEYSAHPRPENLQPGLSGPVSGGCVRIADPCAVKRQLIRLVGVGKLHKNDRGSYHWLNKNVEVLIVDEEAESDEALTIANILERTLTSMESGLRKLMNVFGP